MNRVNDPERIRAAVATLERDRTEARSLFAPHTLAPVAGDPGVFPRSRTFRWLLRHPIGRWVGSAVITAGLAKIPLGRLFVPRLLRG